MSENERGKTWETVGYVSVDAGTVVVADLAAVDGRLTSDQLENDGLAGETKYDVAGTAVYVSSGYGDGNYPVQVRYCEGTLLPGKRVAEMRVVFIDEG